MHNARIDNPHEGLGIGFGSFDAEYAKWRSRHGLAPDPHRYDVERWLDYCAGIAPDSAS